MHMPNTDIPNSERFKKFTLVITCSASFLTPFLGNALNLAIPDIGTAFQASALSLSWIVTSFLLASAAFLLPFGRLADIIGRKKLFLYGLLFFSLSSFLCACAWSIHWLIFFRVVQGVSASMIFGTPMAILTSVFPPEHRGKVLGINAAVVYLGLSLGPVIGGFLTYQWGWASIFILSGILNLIIFFLALTQLKGEWIGSPGEAFNWQGSILYIIGIAAFLYGISTWHEHLLYGLVVLAGLIILFFFVRHELRVDFPLLPLRLLMQNRLFAFSNLTALINYAASFSLVFLLSLYLQSILHIDSKTAGFILLSQPIVMTVLSPITGRLSDRINAKTVSSWGMVVCMLALFFFSFIGHDTPMYIIIANLIFTGVGFALFASPNTNAVMGSVEKRFYGMASATLSSMRLVGQSISMALVTLMLGKYVGSVQLSAAPPDQLLAGIKIAFTGFSVICFFGVIASRQKEKN